MRIALLTTDGREQLRDYARAVPLFGTAPEALIEGFSLLPEVELHVISCLQQCPVGSPKKLSSNVYFHALHVPRYGWLRTAYQGCIRVVRRALKNLRPDIVHGQGTERDCSLCAVLSGFPNVVTIHGNMAELARLFGARPLGFDWLTARLENWTLPRTAGVFCNSAYTEHLVAPRARQTWRVPNAVRSMFFRSRPIRSVIERPVILNVGVISPRKRQLELLREARKWHESGCRFMLDFVGDCLGLDTYQRTFMGELESASELGFARFSGLLYGSSLLDKFDEAQAVIHFPNEEAFGLVVAEALARNLKFFGSRLGGILEIATGIEGAELRGPADWKGLSEAVTEWLKSGAPTPSDAASEIEMRYHPRRIAGRHLEIYRAIVTG